MSLPRFGVTRPVPVNLLMVALLLAGAIGGFTLRRQFFPEIRPQLALVSLPYPGATPEEIEETLVIKVEDALADLDEVESLTTTISEGGGAIQVEFRDGVRDIRRAVDEVEQAIDTLQDLPDEAERIVVSEFEPRLPVIMLTVFGEVDEETLKRAIRDISDDLKTLPGMGEVVLSGVRDYEIRVDVREETLLEHGISLPQVSDAIRRWMSDVPGGSVRSAAGNVNVRTIGVPEQAEAIREIVIKGSRSGQALRVGDIATVRESFVDEQIITRFNGHRSAGLTVFKVGEQDIVKMAEMVRAYSLGRRGEELVLSGLANLVGASRKRAWEIGRAAPSLPDGVELMTHSDLARFVEGRLSLLTRNALQGAVLVFGTLLLFLNWRVAWWVGVGLTTALAGTLVVMQLMGITLNLLTMFGLIVVLGILVDDAIVVAENIQARHDRAEASLVAAIRGAEQVSWPVVATVLTTIVAFLPLTFIRGQIGDLLGALPLVVACALSMSLVESLLILPSHMGHSLVQRDKSRQAGGRISVVFRYERWRDHVILNRIVPAYARLLRLSLNYRYVSLAFAILTLLVSVGALAGGRVGYTFLPEEDAETVVVDLHMPIGSSVEATNAVVERIESAARAQPEVKTISAIVGQRADIDAGTVDSSATHIAQAFIELVPVEQRDRRSVEVVATVRQALGTLVDVERLSFREVGGGPGGADISLEVRGRDEMQILAAAEDIKAELARFAGVYDIFDDNALGQRELQINLRPGAAALGFSVEEVARQVRGTLHGSDAHVFSDRREDIDVRVRLDERTRRSLSAIENLWLIGPEGHPVALGEIAELRDGSSHATIRRVDRQRSVTIMAETALAVSPELIFEQLDLAGLQAKYPALAIERAGRQEQQAEAFATLPLGFGAALVMIYVILAWLFSSYTQPVAVMLAIPFGVIGVIWGHVILGFDLTFLSMIGFVALSGIVVNDSLIFVQFFNEVRVAGMPMQEALIAAGRQRLRPIFLTTITTVLGLTPLMLEQSFQARFLIPMAISIAFGLMSATVLILLVLPCIIVIVDDVKRIAYFLWHGLPRPTEPPARAVFTIDSE